MEDAFHRLLGVAGTHDELVPEGAGERVAHHQAVVEERKRHALGVRFQPQGQLGQLNGQRVLVHAVETVHGHHAAAEGLGLGLRNARLLALGRPAGQVAEQLVFGIGQVEDALSILERGRLGSFFVGGRDARAPSPAFGVQGLLIAQAGRLVEVGTKEPAGFHQEMATAHGRVEDLELEDFARAGIVRRRALGHLRPECLLDQEADEGVRCVVGAAGLAPQADAEVEPARRDLFDPMHGGLLAALGGLFFVLVNLWGVFVVRAALTLALSRRERGLWTVLFTLGDRYDDFELLAAQAAHGLAGNTRLQFQQGFVDASQVFHVERPVVDPFARAFLALGRGPEELVQQVCDCPFSPAELREHRRGRGAEERPTQWLDIQLGTLDPLVEHLEQRAQAGFQEPAGLDDLVQHRMGEPGQGHAGAERVSPEAGRGEAERPGRVVAGFELEDEQQPVDEHQPFVPEVAGQGAAILLLIEPGAVVRVVEHLLDEALDGLAGLIAKVLCDAGLLQAGLVDQVRHCFDARGRSQGQKQAERVGHVAASLPARIDRDDHLGVGPGGV